MSTETEPEAANAEAANKAADKYLTALAETHPDLAAVLREAIGDHDLWQVGAEDSYCRSCSEFWGDGCLTLALAKLGGWTFPDVAADQGERPATGGGRDA